MDIPVLALDLELLGPLHPIKAIGACLTLEPSHTIIEQFKVSICTNRWEGMSAEEFWAKNKGMAQLVETKADKKYHDLLFSNCGFEYKCLKNFWMRSYKGEQKHLALFADLDKRALPFQKAVNQLIWFCQRQLKTYGDKLVIVNDNPASDIGLINGIFRKRNHNPLTYRPSGAHRSIQDVKMLIKGHMNAPHDRYAVRKFLKRYNFESPVIDHDPLHDALNIAQLYGYYLLASQLAHQVSFPINQVSQPAFTQVSQPVSQPVSQVVNQLPMLVMPGYQSAAYQPFYPTHSYPLTYPSSEYPLQYIVDGPTGTEG